MNGTYVVAGGPSLRGWSHQVDMMSCPQRWAFRFAAGVVEETVAEPLAQGTLAHVGLAQYWEYRRRQLYGEDVTELASSVDAIASVAHTEDLRRMEHRLEPGYRPHIGMAQHIMRVYEVMRPHDALLEPHGVEYPAELWIAEGRLVAPPADAEYRRTLAREGHWAEFYMHGAPWLATMRLDFLGYARSQQAQIIVDWKTGMKLDKRKERGFGISGQFIGHVLWGSEHYTGFGGAWVGFVHKRNIGAGNRNIADTFPIFQAAVGVEAIKNFPRAVQHRAETLARLFESGESYFNWPRAFSEQGPCEDRYGPCGYMRACGG